MPTRRGESYLPSHCTLLRLAPVLQEGLSHYPFSGELTTAVGYTCTAAGEPTTAGAVGASSAATGDRHRVDVEISPAMDVTISEMTDSVLESKDCSCEN